MSSRAEGVFQYRGMPRENCPPFFFGYRHDAKPSVAARLGKGDAPVLHTLMRHSSMQITMDYYASVDDVLADKINQR